MLSSDNNFLLFITFIVVFIVAFISIIRIISIIVNEIWFSFAERRKICLHLLQTATIKRQLYEVIIGIGFQVERLFCRVVSPPFVTHSCRVTWVEGGVGALYDPPMIFQAH